MTSKVFNFISGPYSYFAQARLTDGQSSKKFPFAVDHLAKVTQAKNLTLNKNERTPRN